MALRFFDCRVALSAIWDGLICNLYTPAQSKHTFPSGEHSSSEIDILSEKEGSKNGFKKRFPARRKQLPIPGSGGPWSSSLACALFGQETVVRATVEALFEIAAEKKCGPGPKLGHHAGAVDQELGDFLS